MAVAADLDAGLLVIGSRHPPGAECSESGDAATGAHETVKAPTRNYQAHPHHLTADSAIKPAATVVAEINTSRDSVQPG
jgi:hypothetical protein